VHFKTESVSCIISIDLFIDENQLKTQLSKKGFNNYYYTRTMSKQYFLSTVTTHSNSKLKINILYKNVHNNRQL